MLSEREQSCMKLRKWQEVLISVNLLRFQRTGDITLKGPQPWWGGSYLMGGEPSQNRWVCGPKLVDIGRAGPSSICDPSHEELQTALWAKPKNKLATTATALELALYACGSPHPPSDVCPDCTWHSLNPAATIFIHRTQSCHVARGENSLHFLTGTVYHGEGQRRRCRAPIQPLCYQYSVPAHAFTPAQSSEMDGKGLRPRDKGTFLPHSEGCCRRATPTLHGPSLHQHSCAGF